MRRILFSTARTLPMIGATTRRVMDGNEATPRACQTADLGDCRRSSPPRRLDDARERSVVGQSAAACPLAESPQATRCVKGSDDFVASIAAPTATGWNDSCRAGFAPAEDARLGTAHSILTLRGCVSDSRAGCAMP